MKKHCCHAIVENDVYLMMLHKFLDIELSNTCVSSLLCFSLSICARVAKLDAVGSVNSVKPPSNVCPI